jgi:hypothetical protein
MPTIPRSPPPIASRTDGTTKGEYVFIDHRRRSLRSPAPSYPHFTLSRSLFPSFLNVTQLRAPESGEYNGFFAWFRVINCTAISKIKARSHHNSNEARGLFLDVRLAETTVSLVNVTK